MERINLKDGKVVSQPVGVNDIITFDVINSKKEGKWYESKRQIY
jgi:hypothetical protein